MLPQILRKENSIYDGGIEWEKYLLKIGNYADTIDNDFLSQICYEHFDRFNNYFPKFDISIHKIERIKLSTKEIYENIKYYRNEKLDFWYFQIDDYLREGKRRNYKVLKYAIENGTWEFPPVIIEIQIANKIGKGNFGKPIHLIEGTHRISFIKRLFELEKINSDFEHELIMIKE